MTRKRAGEPIVVQSSDEFARRGVDDLGQHVHHLSVRVGKLAADLDFEARDRRNTIWAVIGAVAVLWYFVAVLWQERGE